MDLYPKMKTDDELHFSPRDIGIVENLKSKVRVEREKYTNILNISITDPDPVFAQRMANTVATTYKKLHAEQQGRRTADAIKYIDDQAAGGDTETPQS